MNDGTHDTAAASVATAKSKRLVGLCAPRNYVTIKSTDKGFYSQSCGTWSKV